MTAKITTTLTVQQWGNSLAVRIPAGIARRAHLQPGTLVALTLKEVGVAVKPIGQRKLTLDERLKLFNAAKHGGEAMAAGLIGAEKLK